MNLLILLCSSTFQWKSNWIYSSKLSLTYCYNSNSLSLMAPAVFSIYLILGSMISPILRAIFCSSSILILFSNSFFLLISLPNICSFSWIFYFLFFMTVTNSYSFSFFFYMLAKSWAKSKLNIPTLLLN